MKRLHVPSLRCGELPLPAAEAHHARDVLRLGEGEAVELFDASGHTASATIRRCSAKEVVLEVLEVRPPPEQRGLQWAIASAIPKGSRVDWMIEKLSELGAAAFIPLRTQRGVVLPQGLGKRQRWERLAAEAAKQSRRAGILRIDELTDVPQVLAGAGERSEIWYLSSEGGRGVLDLIAASRPSPPRSLTLMVGPEGGWSPQERSLFEAAGLPALSLGPTVLRIETAAVAAAVLAAGVVAPALAP